MKKKPSIIVENVGKKFGLSLKSSLKFGMIDSARRVIGHRASSALRCGEFWAVDDVSFSIEPGDALGIMGLNGSGKTTLLRILNGTYSPDKGKVTLRGRIGALIAAGAGFSPMLTGRENVFISGTILGMTPAEIRKKFDEIIAFAELEAFIDMPVRNYSSGMNVRLGFAVAVLGNPDILLIDEVLAVGDMNFQKRCFERIQTLKSNGTTILLVSHSPGAIWTVCNKGIVMHHGQSCGIIPVEQACKDYEQYNLMERQRSNCKEHENLSPNYDSVRCGTGDAFINKIEILDALSKNITSAIPFQQPFIIRAYVTVNKDISEAIIRISIDSELYKCICIIDNYENNGKLYTLEAGNWVVDIAVDNPNIRPGVYSITAAILNKSVGVHIFLEHAMTSFVINHSHELFLYADPRAVLLLDVRYDIRSE